MVFNLFLYFSSKRESQKQFLSSMISVKGEAVTAMISIKGEAVTSLEFMLYLKNSHLHGKVGIIYRKCWKSQIR